MIATFAVLLEEYRPLPFQDWGNEIAALMDEHLLDVRNVLRKQQGIVWDGLDRERADRLGSFLIDNGCASGLVETSEIVRFDTPTIIRNADPVPEGIELEDLWEKKSLVRKESVLLAQAGYVEAKVEIGSSRKHPSSEISQAQRQASFNYSRNRMTEPVGIVLHIFIDTVPVDVVRIIGKHFNYDYQELADVSKSNRFLILLNDIAKVLPYECLDTAFKESMGASSIPHETTFKTLDQMLERARWALTIKRVAG